MSLNAFYWYGSIFLWLFFTGIGLPPVPEELAIVYSVGVAAETEEVRWWAAWLCTVAGIIAADMTLYSVGRIWGRRLLKYRWLQRVLSPTREERIERSFRRHGGKIVLTARLLPPLRTSVFITAGLIRFPFYRFALVDCFCAAIATTLVFAGWGSLWNVVKVMIEQFRQPHYWLVVVIIFAAGGYAGYRYLRFVRQRSAREDLEPPTLEEIVHPEEARTQESGVGSQESE